MQILIKCRYFLSTLFCLAAGLMSAAAIAASSASTDIPLGVPAGFISVAINSVGNALYCVSGEVLDDVASTKTAWVVLVDADKRQVVWKTSIPFEQPFVGNIAVQCASNGSTFYVLTQQRTHSEESLNQTKVIINQLSGTGKPQKHVPVDAGFDEWSYLLDVKPDAVSVVGGISDTLNRGGKFSTFLAQFDPNLTRTRLSKMPNGSFWTDTNARLDNSHLLVAGQFLPNSGSSSGSEAFAVSSIDLSKDKYLWSTYVSPADERSEKSIFGADGASYYVALTATNLAVAVVDPAGKITNRFAVKKPVCDINALAIDGHTLSAIGATCDQNPRSVILAIDLTNKSATIAQRLDSSLSTAKFDGNAWAGVADSQAKGAVFIRGAR